MNTTRRRMLVGIPFALLAILWAISIAYGVGLGGALRQAPWYMWGDQKKVPVWLESIDPFANTSGSGEPVVIHYDPVEMWGLDPDEMRQLLQKHGVLTDTWRSELQKSWATGNIESQLTSYRGKIKSIVAEYFGKIDKEKWAGLSGLRAPLSVLCSGCRPSRESAQSFLLRLNAAPRLFCDWIVGTVLWLLATSLVVVPSVLVWAAKKRSMSAIS